MGKSEFEKYAAGHAGISSLKLHRFNTITQEYISPTIIEERQMNVATMGGISFGNIDCYFSLGRKVTINIDQPDTGFPTA